VAIIDYGKLLLLDTPQNLKKTIGDGDVLEMTFENSDEKKLDQFIERINRFSEGIKKGSNFILIKHPNIIEHLSEIKNSAESNGLFISEIKLRENTLEDVFIHLTGRNLRQ